MIIMYPVRSYDRYFAITEKIIMVESTYKSNNISNINGSRPASNGMYFTKNPVKNFLRRTYILKITHI